MELDFFHRMENLEPKCPGCETVIDYGLTTKFDEKKKTHVCLKCGIVLK